jgi:uncharacterized protein YndB with AHSA1/START domain
VITNRNKKEKKMEKRTGTITVNGEEATVTFERHLPHPVEKVWAAITEPEKRAVWFGPTTIDPREDGTVSIDITPKGEDRCEVTFVQNGKDIATELRELPAGEISASEKGWQQGFDLMETAWTDDKT